jgi:ubiquinol-cytochrome c reductase cytochrome c subunit
MMSVTPLKPRSRWIVLGGFLATLATLATSHLWAQPAPSPGPAAQIEQGRAIYRSKGCYECHGLAAQGALGVAPALKPPRLTLEAFKAYVRKPSGQMPPYSAALLPNTEIEAVFSYLRSLPKTPGAAEIPLLAPYVAQPSRGARISGDLATGAGLYRQYCAACHGSAFEGGAGPSLRGEGARRSVEQIAVLIRDPPPSMPKLFPAPLSERDLGIVAAYVHSTSGGASTTGPGSSSRQ